MTKFKDKMNSYKKHPGSFLLLLLVVAAAIITVAVLLYLVAYILIHGVLYLKPSLFALEYNSDNVSMLPQNMHFHWTWIVIGIVITFIVLFFIYLGAII